MKRLVIMLAAGLMTVAAMAQKQFHYSLGNNITLLFEAMDDVTDAVMVKGMDWLDEQAVAIVVPESVTDNGKTYTVAAVGENAFRNRDVTEIVLPNSIKTIGRNAFTDCRYLTKIQLSNQLETIQFEAFRACTKLKEITFPKTVTRIERGAFQDCLSLRYVELPNLDYIAPDMFRYCIGLNSVKIPASVKKIGSEAFKECLNLVAEIPAYIELGHKTFFHCKEVTKK